MTGLVRVRVFQTRHEPVTVLYAGSEPPAASGMYRASGWFYVYVTGTMTEPLTAADRCDRCNAQAYVRVVLPVGELLFCAHHAREHAPKFEELATHVHDETDRLLAEHGAGAGAASV
jgi:hypothetical protein